MAGKEKIKSLILTDTAGKARTLRKYVGRQYLIMSTDGFLKDLPKTRLGIDAEKNYLPGYITVRGKGPLLNEIKRETLKARRVFFAMNPDGAGEFLAKQCCELFGVNLKSRCRLILDEMTKPAIKFALENAVPIDKNLAESFQTRQIIDKFVSQKIADYLACKIYRGLKVGRFRAMLLKLVAGTQPDGEISVGKKFTSEVLQELAFQKLNFSATKTRLILEQLYEGISSEAEGIFGLVKFPHGGEILLTSDARPPESVKPYLNGGQFKLYELIYSQATAAQVSEKIILDGKCSEASLTAVLDSLKVGWAEFYSVGINSLIKRRYVAAENSEFKVTELGEKILSALDGFFDELFSAETYNKIAAQIAEVRAGKLEKDFVIKNYLAEFEKSFDAAMSELGENPQPKDEPVIESGEFCEKCGRPMLIKHGRYGQFLSCAGYPECKNAKPLVDYLEQKCPKCGGRLTKRKAVRRRTFYGCENFPNCDFHTWDEPQERPCRSCGATMFLHRFKDRSPMLYCGNENCPTRENHPMNKIIEESRRRYEDKKLLRAKE